MEVAGRGELSGGFRRLSLRRLERAPVRVTGETALIISEEARVLPSPHAAAAGSQHERWGARMILRHALLTSALAAAVRMTLAFAACGSTSAVAQRCGAIQSGQPAVATSAAGARVATTCFEQAYSHCAPASLTFARSFGDGWTQDTMYVAPGQGSGGVCGLMVRWSTTIVGGHTTTGQDQCAGLQQRADPSGTLVFTGCAKAGDIEVPPGP